MEYLVELLRYCGQTIAILVVAVFVAIIVNALFFKSLRTVSGRSSQLPNGTFTRHCRKPFRWFLIIIAVYFALTVIKLPDNAEAAIKQLISIALIGIVSWLIIKATCVFDDFITVRFDIGQKDNLRARTIHTQLRVTKRIVIAIITIIAVCTMLMTFDKVKQLGATILASAGIIGLVVGFAAQRSIGTFIAGLQIAFTQPIRVDDVVIVENEWGRIEEITLTYVVVKIWDLRRLIVPINYFIEKPFQNWTRTSADLLGTVLIYVDYTVPVEEIRQYLKTILQSSELWDKKVCALQVTNAAERTVELRALMSTADASAGWTLRCEVREKLIEFIKTNYSYALPRCRVELESKKD